MLTKIPADYRWHLKPNHPMADARLVRRERYAWPGGYPLALVTADGALLCPSCVASEFHQISSAYRDHSKFCGWYPEALTVLYSPEDNESCDHCGNSFFPQEEE